MADAVNYPPAKSEIAKVLLFDSKEGIRVEPIISGFWVPLRKGDELEDDPGHFRTATASSRHPAYALSFNRALLEGGASPLAGAR